LAEFTDMNKTGKMDFKWEQKNKWKIHILYKGDKPLNSKCCLTRSLNIWEAPNHIISV